MKPKVVVAEEAMVSLFILHCYRAVSRVERSLVKKVKVLHCPAPSSVLFCSLYTCFPLLVLHGSESVVIGVAGKGKHTSELSSSLISTLQIAVEFST